MKYEISGEGSEECREYAKILNYLLFETDYRWERQNINTQASDYVKKGKKERTMEIP